MSLRIVKPGLLDTLQDFGRYGFQHLGINPGGAMDIIAMQVANALVGNNLGEGVLEMHFPAPVILFERDAMIALSGGTFEATISDVPAKFNQPVIIGKGCELKFLPPLKGARIYLAVHGGFNIDPWLRSLSTNLKAAAGGYKGRALRSGDIVPFKVASDYPKLLQDKNSVALPWQADTNTFYQGGPLRFVRSHEYHLLDHFSQSGLETSSFSISAQSDRMGYGLAGAPLYLNEKAQVISSGVSRGTMQLLPSGDMIILMADHQTTGGYPKMGNVILADFHRLAQKRHGENIRFIQADMLEAEELYRHQYLYLLQLQNACTFRLKEYFSEKGYIAPGI